MNKLNYAMLAAAMLLAGQAQASANLLTNGDFELSDPLVSSGGYTVITPAPANQIQGWTVAGISVDLIKDAYGAINNVSVDLMGSPGPGSISQSFNTIAGWTYTLDFDLGKNGYDEADLTFGGVTETVTRVNNANTHFTRSFVALTSGMSTLTFASVLPPSNDVYSGAVIDNVSVTAVPEPETYAMLLAGLGLVGWTVQRRRRIVG